jgi:hypothetical protein
VLRDATRTGTGTVQIFGTFTGTLQFEGTLDDTLAETSWFALSVNPNGAVSFVTSATAPGQWTIPMALVAVRVRASALAVPPVSVRLLVTSASRGGGGGGTTGSAAAAGAANSVQVGDGAGGFTADVGFTYNAATDSIALPIAGCYTISTDTFLCRTAANTWAAVNGVAAQTFHVYGTTTGPRRLTLAHSGTRASVSSGTDPIDVTAVSFVPAVDKGVDLGDATHRYKNTYTTQPVVPLNAAGNSGAAIAIDWSTGARQSVTMTGDATFTLTNPIAGGTYYLFLTEDATGSRVPAWPGTVKWSGGTAPTLSGANKVDIISLVYDGAAYYGAYVLNF